MTCNRCGICCRTQSAEIDDSYIRAASFRKNFRKIVKSDGKTYAIFDSECKHFKGNRCAIYERRPETCKTFPQDKERWRLVNPDCGML